MNNIVCIDYENRADIKKLFCFSDVKFVSFIGAEQQDKIKIEEGTKLSRKRMNRTGKDYLDWNLIMYIKNRLQQKDTKFYIVSDDNIFISFANYINTTSNKKKIEIINKARWNELKLGQ